MSYPGNLFALVARERHVTSQGGAGVVNDNAHEQKVDTRLDERAGKAPDRHVASAIGTVPAGRPQLKRRRTARAGVSRSQDKSIPHKVHAPQLRTTAQAQPAAFVVPGPRSDCSLGAKVWQAHPSELGKRMDAQGKELPPPLSLATKVAPGSRKQSPCGSMDSVDCSARGRALDREQDVAVRAYERALSVRRRHWRRHALSLVRGVLQPEDEPSDQALSGRRPPFDDSALDEDPKECLHRAFGKPRALRVRKYSHGQARHLHVSLQPRNAFRASMAPRARESELHHDSTTTVWRAWHSRQKGSCLTSTEAVARARAGAAKSRWLRYSARWREIASLHRLLEAGTNRRPAAETLERVGRALKGVACESPAPGFLSRSQLVSTLSKVLDSCDVGALQRLFSTFDPDCTDRVRCADIVGCLLVTHKPGTQASLEGLQQTFILNLGAISKELHAELSKDGRQVAWRFLRKLFSLYDDFGEGKGLSTPMIEQIFQLCATSDEDLLQMSSIFAAWNEGEFGDARKQNDEVLTEAVFVRSFCTAWPLLDLFNVHMTACQEIVKRLAHVASS